MNDPHYLFIHPLLTPDDSCAGYRCELLPETDAAPLLSQLVADPCWPQFPSTSLWLAPAQAVCEAESRLLPVFGAHPTAEQQTLLARLRQAGRRVALALQPEQPLPPAGEWDLLLMRCSHARTLPPLSLLGLSARSTLIASEVCSHADHDWAGKNAFTLSSCEYLLTRAANGNKADTVRTRLLRLLALIAEDASTGDLEAVFRQEPKLSYSLLRLVNSAAVAPRVPITSFGQAINLLGRRQLQRWLQLLIYADPDNGQRPNPLLLKAAARGHLLERLSRQLDLAAELEQPQDAAFMVGSFSLLDVLLNRPLPEILGQLPLAPAVRNALAEQQGPLGRLLAAIQYGEAGKLELAEKLFAELAISPADHLAAQLVTLHWIGGIQLSA